MNSAFALVLTVFLVSGEPVDIADSVHRTMQECMTAATEQKIPGNCDPVDKVIHQDNIEIPAALLNSSVINIRFHSYMPAMAGICSSLNLS